MEPATGLTILGTAVGSAKLLERLLGPTASYLGEGIKQWTEQRVTNVARIFTKAAQRLGTKLDEDGSVPPRVLKAIIDDGSFCDDQLGAEYFGGVLASSRTGVSRDDRAAFYLGILTRLSTYQIRTHYLYYRTLKTLLDGSGLELGSHDDRSEMQIYFPLHVYATAMDFDEAEKRQWQALAVHAFNGLCKEDLLDDIFMIGTADGLRKEYPRAKDLIASDGCVFSPTLLGAELFLWVHGCPNVELNDLLNSSLRLDLVDVNLEIPPGAAKLTE